MLVRVTPEGARSPGGSGNWDARGDSWKRKRNANAVI
jgi:hypothetical protein